MRKLHSAITLLIAFILAYVATPGASEPLQAQVGVPCTCATPAGSTGDQWYACLGTGNMDAVSCSQIGSRCWVTGTATWVPDSPTCAFGIPTGGWIQAAAFGSGGPYYFDPSKTYKPSGVPWGVLSADCSGGIFGAQMKVAHKGWNQPCTCIDGYPGITGIATKLWSCVSF